jgi:hypothetical protein
MVTAMQTQELEPSIALSMPFSSEAEDYLLDLEEQIISQSDFAWIQSLTEADIENVDLDELAGFQSFCEDLVILLRLPDYRLILEYLASSDLAIDNQCESALEWSQNNAEMSDDEYTLALQIFCQRVDSTVQRVYFDDDGP